MSRVRKVKLIRDFSHVHPDLKVGAIGELGGNVGFDSNFRVYFPQNGKTLNLFENSFDYVLHPEEQVILDQQLASAFDVVYTTGPKNGYKYLEFQYNLPEKGVAIYRNRREGMQIMEQLKALNIPIKINKLTK